MRECDVAMGLIQVGAGIVVNPGATKEYQPWIFELFEREV